MGNNSKSSVVYQGKIPGRVKYTFAFGALGKDLIYGMIATFSMIYFTDIIKVAPAFIGTMFFVAKIWDAFNDLFMGMIVDNTRSRWKVCSVACNRNADQCVRICNCIYRFSSDRCEALRLCDGCIYFMGNDLYHHGYSILVSDSESDF